MRKTIKGYKAFNKGLICKGFQFKENQTYETKEEIEICKKGFHFCTNPFDVLDYYNLIDSEFAEVESLGKIQKHKEDSKIVTDKIKIGIKLSFKSFIELGVKFLIDITKNKKSGSSGYSAQIELNGEDSVAMCAGINSIIKGKIGNWITLAEWKYNNNKKRYVPICVKSAQIDGKELKEDTFYKLENGNFKEVK